MPIDIDNAALWAEIDDFLIPTREHPWYPWFCPRPTVRILFYTDDPTVVLGTSTDFGVGRLRDLIVGHNDFFATFSISLVNRHATGHASDKLTTGLLNDYDQVWFFGVRQCNVSGAPENELTTAEVSALRNWMDGGGGVLMTGDHSNLRPTGADPALDQWVNLGRALGHRVPRAGRLRRWEGLPNATVAGSHNTQVSDGTGTSLDSLTLQDDAIPQQLILKMYPTGWLATPWLQRCRPHPLFCGRTGLIEVFPDHMHEGQLEVPATFPASDWPSGISGQPRPEVVAQGTDKRTGAVYDVTSAYDGALAGVGRIVADATWHHYFNVNLIGFPAGSATLDSIADFYVNLAVWLAPPAKRSQMRCWNWWYLATHATVRMVAFHPFHVVGGTAMDVLGRRASQCLISELTWPWPVLEVERAKYPWPPEELVLGAVLTQYHQVFEQAETDSSEGRPSRDDLVRAGLDAALEEHVSQLRRAARAAGRIGAVIAEKHSSYAPDERTKPGPRTRQAARKGSARAKT